MYTSMYFTRIRSPFHSSVFNVVRWHSEWIVPSCIEACRMFIKFIYNVLVCQYHCFTQSYQRMTFIWINSLNPHWANVSFLDLWNLLETVWFSEVWLFRYGLTTYLMLLRHCKPMCYYFLPPENFRKRYSFQGLKKLNIGLIWDKSVTVISFNYHEHPSIYCWNVHVRVALSILVARKIINQ